jgi:hypothetical protein
VAKKHDFCSIQRKIPQKSNFDKKWDSNPLPHGEIAADIAKGLCKIYSENQILGKTIFADFRRYLLIGC